MRVPEISSTGPVKQHMRARWSHRNAPPMVTQRGYPAGALDPTQVVITAQHGAPTTRQLARFAAQLGRVPGVGRVELANLKRHGATASTDTYGQQSRSVIIAGSRVSAAAECPACAGLAPRIPRLARAPIVSTGPPPPTARRDARHARPGP